MSRCYLDLGPLASVAELHVEDIPALLPTAVAADAGLICPLSADAMPNPSTTQLPFWTP